MAVDEWDGPVIIDTDVVGLDPDHLPMFLVCLVDKEVPLAPAGRHQQPQVGEAGEEGPAQIAKGSECDDVWIQV